MYKVWVHRRFSLSPEYCGPRSQPSASFWWSLWLSPWTTHQVHNGFWTSQVATTFQCWGVRIGSLPSSSVEFNSSWESMPAPLITVFCVNSLLNFSVTLLDMSIHLKVKNFCRNPAVQWPHCAMVGKVHHCQTNRTYFYVRWEVSHMHIHYNHTHFKLPLQNEVVWLKLARVAGVPLLSMFLIFRHFGHMHYRFE